MKIADRATTKLKPWASFDNRPSVSQKNIDARKDGVDVTIIDRANVDKWWLALQDGSSVVAPYHESELSISSSRMYGKPPPPPERSTR
jgi:hypothetical protein